MQPRTFATAVSRPGWRDIVPYVIGRVLSRVSCGRVRLLRYYIVAQPVPDRPSAAAPGRIGVRQVHASDPAVKLFPRPVEVIERRFRDGSACFVVEHGQRVGGFLWLAHGGYDEDEFRCRYEFTRPETTAWDFDVHIEPRFRMGRTFAHLWHGANTYLAQCDVRWSLSRIATINTESLAAHMRLGARILHRMTFLCIGGIQVALLSLPPYFHLSVSTTSRPILHIDVPRGAERD